MEVQFVESKNLKEKPTGALGFGKYYTDYMFVMDWDAGQEWHDARVIPYGPLEFDPASMVLHYAQETFEGLKAYRTKDGKVQLFRPEMNAKRFANSNKPFEYAYFTCRYVCGSCKNNCEVFRRLDSNR